jgi:hypothetical protein
MHHPDPELRHGYRTLEGRPDYQRRLRFEAAAARGSIPRVRSTQGSVAIRLGTEVPADELLAGRGRRMLDRFGGLTQKAFDMSHSQCCVAEASASQIGSRVVSGVDLYSIVKELVTEQRPQNGFRVAPERDQGVARGPGGPPYYGAETAKRFGDCALRGCWPAGKLLPTAPHGTTRNPNRGKATITATIAFPMSRFIASPLPD